VPAVVSAVVSDVTSTLVEAFESSLEHPTSEASEVTIATNKKSDLGRIRGSLR